MKLSIDKKVPPEDLSNEIYPTSKCNVQLS